MYGLNLTFKILNIINKAPQALTITEIAQQIDSSATDYAYTNLVSRIYRHIHKLEETQQIKITTEMTRLKTTYLLIHKN